MTVGVLLCPPTQHVFLGSRPFFCDVDLSFGLACRGCYAAVVFVYVFVYLWHRFTSECAANGGTDTAGPRGPTTRIPCANEFPCWTFLVQLEATLPSSTFRTLSPRFCASIVDRCEGFRASQIVGGGANSGDRSG